MELATCPMPNKPRRGWPRVTLPWLSVMLGCVAWTSYSYAESKAAAWTMQDAMRVIRHSESESAQSNAVVLLTVQLEEFVAFLRKHQSAPGTLGENARAALDRLTRAVRK